MAKHIFHPVFAVLLGVAAQTTNWEWFRHYLSLMWRCMFCYATVEVLAIDSIHARLAASGLPIFRSAKHLI